MVLVGRGSWGGILCCGGDQKLMYLGFPSSGAAPAWTNYLSLPTSPKILRNSVNDSS